MWRVTPKEGFKLSQELQNLEEKSLQDRKTENLFLPFEEDDYSKFPTWSVFI